MMRFKMILTLMSVVILSGCGNHALYLRGGTVGVIEKPVNVIASVPDSTGKLVPGTTVELPAGTEFKYGELKK